MSAMEFQFDSIQRGLVVGRNGAIDIPLGFIFTSIEKVRVDGDIHNLQTVRLGQVAVVNLALEEVHWFRLKIEVVPRGHSAGLLLRGLGFDTLQAELSNLADREYLYLKGPSVGA